MLESQVEISLFPIPGSVSLPFQKVPLHIFEPRYRKMVKDSVENKRRIGIAHTIKEVSPSRVSPDASQEQILTSNLESYEAHPIFSAGFPKIVETLPDGRMIVEIEMDSRYQVIEATQQLPYQIVRCVPYSDDEAEQKRAEILRSQLDIILLSFEGPGTDLLKKYLLSSLWTSLPTHEYSFSIFSFVQVDADFLQTVLLMKTSEERIKSVIQLLTSIAST